MQRYDPGDAANLRRIVEDPDGVPTDSTTTFEYLAPDADDPASASVTHNGTGIYDATITDLIEGVYEYVWTTTGVINDVKTGRFYVAASADEAPPLAPFELLARALGAEPDDFDDAERDRAEGLLDEASELIRDVAGKTWLDPDLGIPVDVPRRVARICVAVAKRGFENPEGLTQRVIGDSSKGYDRTGREGGEAVYLTAEEESAILKAAGLSGFQSVTLVSAYSGESLDAWEAVNAE